MPQKKVRLPDPGVTWAFASAIQENSPERNLCYKCLRANKPQCPKMKLEPRIRFVMIATRCFLFLAHRKPEPI